MPRQNFYHGLLVDVPATLHSLAEGAESEGLVVGGITASVVPVARADLALLATQLRALLEVVPDEP